MSQKLTNLLTSMTRFACNKGVTGDFVADLDYTYFIA